MKYTQDVKDRAVEAAKAGKSLTEIQQTIGPNPKATQRYLAKIGINYTELRTELKNAGKLQAKTNTQEKSSEKASGKLATAVVANAGSPVHKVQMPKKKHRQVESVDEIIDE